MKAFVSLEPAGPFRREGRAWRPSKPPEGGGTGGGKGGGGWGGEEGG